MTEEQGDLGHLGDGCFEWGTRRDGTVGLERVTRRGKMKPEGTGLRFQLRHPERG